MNLFRYVKLALFIFLLSSRAELNVSAEEKALDIVFDSTDKILSVRVNATPLSVILKEIGKKIDCKIVLLSSHDHIITDSFSGLSLKKGIQRLAREYSLAIIYQIADSDGNGKELQAIREIWLFEGGKKLLSDITESTGKNLIPAELPGLPPDRKEKPAEEFIPQPSARQMNLLIRHPLDEDTSLGFWAKKLFESGEYDDKAQSITELQRIDNEDVLPVIATVLGDEDAALRRHAVESLKLIDNEGALLLIGQALIGDSDASVRKAALGYFSERQDDISKAFLNTALKDSNRQIRELAQKSLEFF